jgi:hypothetical protein
MRLSAHQLLFPFSNLQKKAPLLLHMMQTFGVAVLLGRKKILQLDCIICQLKKPFAAGVAATDFGCSN